MKVGDAVLNAPRTGDLVVGVIERLLVFVAEAHVARERVFDVRGGQRGLLGKGEVDVRLAVQRGVTGNGIAADRVLQLRVRAHGDRDARGHLAIFRMLLVFPRSRGHDARGGGRSCRGFHLAGGFACGGVRGGRRGGISRETRIPIGAVTRIDHGSRCSADGRLVAGDGLGIGRRVLLSCGFGSLRRTTGGDRLRSRGQAQHQHDGQRDVDRLRCEHPLSS